MPFRRTSIDSNQRTGFYSPKRSRVVGSRVVGYDSDALVYINAVEAADGQALEGSVKDAYNTFVVGCKSDGIWNAIKASCIMAGARTLSGALVPLVGVAPTNNNFVSGDYNRTTGLVGDGSTKYLDSNRLRTADPQNSFHLAINISTLHTFGTVGLYAGAGVETTTSASGFTILGRLANGNHYVRNTASTFTDVGSSATGFFGTNRSMSASYSYRHSGATTTVSTASEVLPATTVKVFAGRLAAGLPNNPVSARLSFYSIGESLDLALLDARVSGLMVAISGAIS